MEGWVEGMGVVSVEGEEGGGVEGEWRVGVALTCNGASSRADTEYMRVVVIEEVG